VAGFSGAVDNWVTSLGHITGGYTAEYLYADHYCASGNAENLIKLPNPD
jgi:hypothetical protein